MKRLRKAVALGITAVLMLTALPLNTLAAEVQPYERVEHPETGVTIYYNKDGSETLVVEAAPTDVGAADTAAASLQDRGGYLEGGSNAVLVKIDKQFDEGKTLVTVGTADTSVSFYPMIQDIVPEPAEPASTEGTPAAAPEASLEASEPITGGTITAFVGYTEKTVREPLKTETVSSTEELSALTFPDRLKVTLADVEQPYRLPVRKWTKTDCASGGEAAEWRFQPEWDIGAFPLSDELQRAIIGDPGDAEDDDPYVIPYILVTLTEEAEETPESSVSPSPSESPEPSGSPEPEPSVEPGGSEPSMPGATETPPPTETPVPEETQEPVQQEPKPPQTEEPSVAEGGNVLTALRPNSGYTIGRLAAVRWGGQEPGTPVETEVPAAPAETIEPSVETAVPETGTPESSVGKTPEPVQTTRTPSANPSAKPDGDVETRAPSTEPEERGPVSAAGRRRGESAVLYRDVFEEGTDIKLSALQNGIKEDVIIGLYTGNHLYAYRMNFYGLTPVQSGNEILLCRMNRQVGKIHAPYMADANGSTSTAIDVSFHPVGGGAYELTYAPDDGWLAEEGRAYPVTMDPQITFTSSSSSHIYNNFVCSASPNSVYDPGYDNTLTAGGAYTACYTV